jgi:nitrite reductase/ring-hydroxylating ferredoxin subunit
VNGVRIPLSSLDPEGRAVVEVGGTQIAVFVVDGKAHAFANACPHEGNPLYEGDIRGDKLICAYHGWMFDLGTGACLVGEEPAQTYAAEIQGDEVVVTA